jgi:hypothetical protein
MLDFLPHWVLTALVGAIAVLFLDKGRERRDLLFMGLATLFVAIWMVAVTMTDFIVQREHQVPVFWMALTIDALLPALFFVHVSILQLDKHYSPNAPFALRHWLPFALALGAVAVAHGINPDLFFRRVGLEPPVAGKMHLNPLYTLKFSLGFGYAFFLLAAAYVFLGAVARLPRVIAAMQLPQAERRTRALLSLGVLATFWVAAFDVMPTLFSTSAPSLMRLIGPALGVFGTAYAMALTGAFDFRAVLRNALFYSIRILVIAVPAMVLLVRYREPLGELSARWAGFITLCTVVAIDFLALRLKPLLDWLASPKSAATESATGSATEGKQPESETNESREPVEVSNGGRSEGPKAR